MKKGGMNENTIHEELVIVSIVFSLMMYFVPTGLDMSSGMSFDI